MRRKTAPVFKSGLMVIYKKHFVPNSSITSLDYYPHTQAWVCTHISSLTVQNSDRENSEHQLQQETKA